MHDLIIMLPQLGSWNRQDGFKHALICAGLGQGRLNNTQKDMCTHTEYIHTYVCMDTTIYIHMYVYVQTRTRTHIHSVNLCGVCGHGCVLVCGWWGWVYMWVTVHNVNFTDIFILLNFLLAQLFGEFPYSKSNFKRQFLSGCHLSPCHHRIWIFVKQFILLVKSFFNFVFTH